MDFSIIRTFDDVKKFIERLKKSGVDKAEICLIGWNVKEGDKTTNPEVVDTYELIHAEAVEDGKTVPDVIIDFGKAAKACGLGEMGLNGKIINKEHGPFMRYCFIITDAPLDCDEELNESVCDKCGVCIDACPGKDIDKDGNVDPWQCAVYYNGANGTKNPSKEKGARNRSFCNAIVILLTAIPRYLNQSSANNSYNTLRIPVFRHLVF